MQKVKRTIYINDQKFEIWLGLMPKNGGSIAVYLLTDSPYSPLNHANKILSGVMSRDEAIRRGVAYAKKLFRGMMENQTPGSDS